MEAIDQSAPILQPETALRPRPRPSQRKNVASPKRSKSTREVRTKRISPKSAFATGSDTYAGKPTPKPPRTNTSPGRPIVPATERASYGEKLGKRGKKEKDGEKWEIAPDGSSAGREGRQFTVANVGNNGRIYLRYVCDFVLEIPAYSQELDKWHAAGSLCLNGPPSHATKLGILSPRRLILISLLPFFFVVFY
jgi:hypothetical protein